MNNGRPMSEHEGALFDAVLVLAATMLDMGADSAILRERLTAARATADTRGNRHGVETLDFLITSLFAEGAPPAKPSFRVV